MDVIERFLKYVSFGTNSDEESETCPSSAGQLVLGKYLADELRRIGMTDVIQDENGYVYGFLPGNDGSTGAVNNVGNAEPLGLIAHMDTSPSVPGDPVKPQIIRYNGGDIVLANGKTVIIEKETHELKNLIGAELIVTDGNTLLGADDKAGVAEIIAACNRLVSENIPHRPIAVCFTPDEEIGRGAVRFDMSKFKAEVAYTVDGGSIGEIEYENFNAAGMRLCVHGVNIHPGAAKNRMKNAVLMANEFISMLPPAETPAHTEGYEGFYHVMDIRGDETLCTVAAIIRDHDMEKFTQRKQYIHNLCDYLNQKWGEGCFELEMQDSYYNMKEKILPHMELIDNACRAFTEEGITPVSMPIRGGTDGARLSYEGLPCPNLSTGGINFHSCREFIPVTSLEKMVNVLVRLAKV